MRIGRIDFALMEPIPGSDIGHHLVAGLERTLPKDNFLFGSSGKL